MDINTFQVVLISFLTSATTIAFAKIIYTKLLEYKFKKKVDLHRSSLVINEIKTKEYFLKSFEKESNHINDIWLMMQNHITICINFDENKRNELNSSYNKIDSYIYENQPYINVDIYNVVISILEYSNPNSYDKNNLTYILDLKIKLIKSIQQRLYVE